MPGEGCSRGALSPAGAACAPRPRRGGSRTPRTPAAAPRSARSPRSARPATRSPALCNCSARTRGETLRQSPTPPQLFSSLLPSLFSLGKATEVKGSAAPLPPSPPAPLGSAVPRGSQHFAPQPSCPAFHLGRPTGRASSTLSALPMDARSGQNSPCPWELLQSPAEPFGGRGQRGQIVITLIIRPPKAFAFQTQ